jgi:hypothetical protein
VTAELVIEGSGGLDDELSHAMTQLAKYQQAILIYDQLATLFGTGESPIDTFEYENCLTGRDFWAEKFAELLQQDDPETYGSEPAILDAMEYADTYRQQQFVFGVLCPVRGVLLHRDGPGGMLS